MTTQGIDVALTQLGIQELTGHNDGIPAERYMRGDAFAWCAGFALYCNANSDDENVAPTTKDHYRMRAVSAFIEEMRRTKRMLAPFAIPQRNDFVFFSNTDSDVGLRGNHMGIVEWVDVVSGHFSTVEGNCGNRVARVNHRLSERTIVGFARP